MSNFDATVLVKFGDGSDDDFYKVELDGTRNLNDEGDTITQFEPGMPAYFYVHMDVNKYKIANVTKTSGSVTNMGIQSYSTTQPIQFPELASEATLEYLPSSTLLYHWFGNSPSLDLVERTLTNKSSFPAIGEATYSYSGYLFKFTPPSITLTEEMDHYNVLIVVYAEEK